MTDPLREARGSTQDVLERVDAARSTVTPGLRGEDIHREWRDGMLAQGRTVAPERMSWETLSEEDRLLDDGIAERLAATPTASPTYPDGLATGEDGVMPDEEAANQWQGMMAQGIEVSYGARVAVRLWNRLIVAESAARSTATPGLREALRDALQEVYGTNWMQAGYNADRILALIDPAIAATQSPTAGGPCAGCGNALHYAADHSDGDCARCTCSRFVAWPPTAGGLDVERLAQALRNLPDVRSDFLRTGAVWVEVAADLAREYAALTTPESPEREP